MSQKPEVEKKKKKSHIRAIHPTQSLCTVNVSVIFRKAGMSLSFAMKIVSPANRTSVALKHAHTQSNRALNEQ